MSFEVGWLSAPALVVLGALSFSLMGLCVKLADSHMSTFGLLALRSAIGLVLNFFVAGIASRHPVPFPRSPDHASETQETVDPLKNRVNLWLTIRVIAGFASIILEYLALQKMPLATNTVIVYSSPMFIVMWSALLLNERISVNVAVCMCASFIGLLLIAQPWRADSESPLWAYAAALGAAVLAGLVYIALRQLRVVSHHKVLLVFQLGCLVLSIVVGVSLGVFKAPQSNSWPTVGYLIGVGVAAYVAELCITCGYARACQGVGRVSVFKFLTPVFSTVWGVCFLNEKLLPLDFAGSAIVLISSAAIACMQVGTRMTVEKHLVRDNWAGKAYGKVRSSSSGVCVESVAEIDLADHVREASPAHALATLGISTRSHPNS